LLRLQCDVSTEVVVRAEIYRVHEGSLGIVNLDEAVLSWTIGLEDKKQLVDGIELDVEPTVRLPYPTGKVFADAGLGFEIVKLNTSVVSGGRTGNAIVGIDGEPLESFAQSLKLIEFARVQIDRTDLRSAIVTSLSLRENTCIRLDIEREAYGGKGLEVGISHGDLFAKGLLLHIFLEGKVSGSRVDVMQDEKRRVGGSLIVADARNNVVAVKMRRLPKAGVLVRIERTYQMVGAYVAVGSSVFV